MLAISKSRGEVKDYLDGLRFADEETDDVVAAHFNRKKSSSTVEMQPAMNEAVETARSEVRDGRDFERWLFSDWLNKSSAGGGRRKEPALPILKEAKWNSGDNPVLVTALIMLVGVVVASVTERIVS